MSEAISIIAQERAKDPGFATYYSSSLEHLLGELARVDFLIRAQVSRARQVQQGDDEFQGLYISEQEVDALLEQPVGLPPWVNATGLLSEANIQAIFGQMALQIANSKQESLRQGITLRLEKLSRLFQLNSFDIDALLISLAPELDLRYQRLFAYLQDDITKKHPNVDLLMNLLCASFVEKLRARQRLGTNAPLLRHQLLQLFADPAQHQPPFLARYVKVDERIVGYLLDSDEPDVRVLPYVCHIVPKVELTALLLPADIKHRLSLMACQAKTNHQGLIFYFQGPYGVGKQATAEALCRASGISLLAVDLDPLQDLEQSAFEQTLRLILREGLLHNAALYWRGFGSLLVDDKQAWRELLLEALEVWDGLSFLAGNTAWEPVDRLHNRLFLRIEFPLPNHSEREQLWALSWDPEVPRAGDVQLEALASRFRFSGGQVRDAAATARNLARWRDPERGQVNMTDLYAACRLQSNRKLTILAQKITPHYHWDDIVLPANRLQQLREICDYVKYRAIVYDDWGFDRKLAMGKGLNVLFAGPSGTGKTMAADIMAGELGLDLYKIDLSTVVSKYIGETEKNLARLFAEAETSNAILFFDEADALFGRRSEVRDSHDRYANIEISYLLQKMEEPTFRIPHLDFRNKRFHRCDRATRAESDGAH